MPHLNQESDSTGNVVNIGTLSEAQQIMSAICDLRQRILMAWHERAVTFTEEEQRQLKNEIAYTCELLTVITSRA